MTHATIITATTDFSAISASKTFAAISKMRATSKQRRDLAKLTTHQLTDIGITAAQRDAECKRRFWQAGQVI